MKQTDSNKYPVNPCLLTFSQAAKYLNCDRGLVAWLVNNGKLLTVSLPHRARKRIPVIILEKYVNYLIQEQLK